MSICVAAKCSSSTVGTHRRVISFSPHGSSDANTDGCLIDFEGVSGWIYYNSGFQGNGSAVVSDSPPTPFRGVVGTKDSTNANIYLDEVVQGSATGDTNSIGSASGNTLSVGCDINNSAPQNFDGIIAEAFFTGSVMSAGDITNLHGYFQGKYGAA